MSATRRERLGIGLLAAGLCIPLVGTPSFCLDDSFIHLAYLQSLVFGDGPSYNPGDWETGISSPLWLLLLWAWPGGVPSVFAIKCLGTALHAATAMLVAACARRADPERGAAFAWTAGLATASTPLLVQGATSGMEVPLTALLVVALSYALVADRPALAALFAGLAYLARPETLAYSVPLALLLSRARAKDADAPRAWWRPLWAIAGAALAALAYSVYCQAVSGYPLPNTFYVKSGGLHLASLRYLFVDVALRQPLVVSVAGLVLCGLGMLRARTAAPVVFWIGVAGGCALCATALTRQLYPGVQFYQSRYFAVFSWVLPWAAGYGVAHLARAPALALLAPVVAATVLLVHDGIDVQRAQERGVIKLHVEPAAFVARKLPDAKVIGVEGAGALRLFTPRAVRIVDLMGLNDHRVAHMDGTLFHKLCYLRARGGTHLAYPAQWRPSVHKAFELDDIARFTEPAYAQMDPPAPWQLTLARIERPKPEFAAFCRSKGFAF